MTPGRRRWQRGDPEPEPQPEETPQPEPVAETSPTPSDAELNEAASAFRVFSHAWRAFQNLDKSVQTALAARHHADQSKRAVSEADKSLAAIAQAKDKQEDELRGLEVKLTDARSALKQALSELDEAKTGKVQTALSHQQLITALNKEAEAHKAQLIRERIDAEAKLAEAKRALEEHLGTLAGMSR